MCVCVCIYIRMYVCMCIQRDNETIPTALPPYLHATIE